MGFFKFKTINWKYIIGEILLLFVGINLAIWFNDWNESKIIQKDKEIALAKIKGEIETNLEELVENNALNQNIVSFYGELDSIKRDDGALILSPQAMQMFSKKYERFFVSVDSTAYGNGLYSYEADTFLNLEISQLSSIAWDISKTTGIFHEFGYDCLYELQGMYNTQDLVKKELEKATEALRNRSIGDLIRILGILDQLESQLEEQYRDMISHIDDCR